MFKSCNKLLVVIQCDAISDVFYISEEVM
jgi:hypothetical protein